MGLSVLKEEGTEWTRHVKDDRGPKRVVVLPSSFTTTSTYALTVECFGQVTGWKALLVSVRRFPPLPSFPCPFPAVGPPRPKLAVLSVSRCPLCTPYGHLQIHPQLGHHWASRDETEVTRAYSSSYFLFLGGEKGYGIAGKKEMSGRIYSSLFSCVQGSVNHLISMQRGEKLGRGPSFFSSFRSPSENFPTLSSFCNAFLSFSRIEKGVKKAEKGNSNVFPS